MSRGVYMSVGEVWWLWVSLVCSCLRVCEAGSVLDGVMWGG